ncbi:MAG: hypothetical protein M3401_02035 [Actinomycetota bacterium]|nr:hypothetical protein [Actinomycetota bacterium]
MLETTIHRSVLLAPDPVARIAAWYALDPEEAWLLAQSRAVRRSYADTVLGRDDERAREIWMLRQSDDVRESYVRDVLERAAD